LSKKRKTNCLEHRRSESPVPSIVRQVNLEAAKVPGRVQRVKMVESIQFYFSLSYGPNHMFPQLGELGMYRPEEAL
jgi:hypothetical protein